MNSTDIIKTENRKKKSVIALTFDDGPGEHTERLLDIFAQYGSKGTFFVVGESLEKKSAVLQRIATEGHEIGNHTLTHSPLTYLTDDDIAKELALTAKKAEAITGKAPTLARPPFGAFDERVGAVGKSANVSFIAWSLDTRDWETKDPAAVYNEIITNAASGDIVLCHDVHKSTVDAMETVIPDLLQKGFSLVTVSELMKCFSVPLESGKLYHNACGK